MTCGKLLFECRRFSGGENQVPEKRVRSQACGISSVNSCPDCHKCVFCWGGFLYRDEFLLENLYEEISPQEWSKLENEARRIRGDVEEKIILVETNVRSPLSAGSCSGSEGQHSIPTRSLVDYQASDFIHEPSDNKELSPKKRLNVGNVRSYTQPHIAEEIWKRGNSAKVKNRSLRSFFTKKNVLKFTNDEGEEGLEVSAAFSNIQSSINLKTKVQTSRRKNTTESEMEGFPTCIFPTSFAAHVRRQGPRSTANCTQTLRRCNLSVSDADVFESEVQSNVTFNPLFDDDDSNDDEIRMRSRKYRLYTIKEESEALDLL